MRLYEKANRNDEINNKGGFFLKNSSLAILFTLLLGCSYVSDKGDKKASKGNELSMIDISSLDIKNKSKDLSYNNLDTLGFYYFSNGLYKEALEVYQQSLDSALVNGDKNTEWNAYSGIGSTYYHQGSYNNQIPYDYALEYYNKALTILDTSNVINLVANLRNIALVYYGKGDSKNQEAFLKKALLALNQSSDEDLHKSDFVFQLYIDFCDYYLNNLDDIKTSKEYLYKAKNIVDKNSNINNEIVYLTWEGDILNYEGDNNGYLNRYLEALDLSIQNNNKRYQKAIYGELVHYYDRAYKITKDARNLEKKDHYSSLFSNISEQLSSEQINNTMAALNIKFEVAKLKSENKEKEAELEIKKAQLGEQKQKNRLAWGGAAAGLLLALGATGFGVTLKKKNKIIKAERDEKEEKNVQLAQAMEEINTINEHLTETNEELEQANAKKEQANAELELTNTELEQTNTKLEKANFDINAGITYASKIQESILKNDISEFFPKSFVFYKSKDTTGGDFYHSSEGLNGKKVLILADCTGHGVPGSFLTIFGKTNLQQISDKLENPNDIIDYMDKQFMNLHKKSVNSMVGDAMDIACVFYDPETKIMEFSSALMNIFIFRKDGEIENIRATDRATVGSDLKPPTFQGYTKKEIQLYSGDEVILYTDGMSDQFDKDGKKLGIAGFKQMLPHLSTIPLTQRASYLQKYYEGLMKKENGEIVPQTDDMTMVGFKVE